MPAPLAMQLAQIIVLPGSERTSDLCVATLQHGVESFGHRYRCNTPRDAATREYARGIGFRFAIGFQDIY
jgi:hypothetical protein